MTWKRRLNAGLRRATGFELRRTIPSDVSRTASRKRRRARPPLPGDRRPPLPGDRLVTAPTFILCSLRSGSTLLRVLLNSHSLIHAPHEFHLRRLSVTVRSKWGERAMIERGLDTGALEYLLWDRILHRELARSGKEQIVCKTPNDVFNVDRILECWPDARFIFLLRHPAAIARSRARLRPTPVNAARNNNRILRYCEALEKARSRHPGLTVRYEELTRDPEVVTQRLCQFLGAPWEPDMLEYGRLDHGKYGAGLGDWKGKIRTGRIQSPEPLPASDEIPPVLRDLAAAWGYLRDPGPAPRTPVEAGAPRVSASAEEQHG